MLLRALLVFGDVLAGKVAEGHTGHAVVCTLDHERVGAGEHVAHHGAYVVQARNRLIVGIAYLHMHVGVQAAEHRQEAKVVDHFAVEGAFFDGVQMLGVLVEVFVDTLRSQLVVALDRFNRFLPAGRAFPPLLRWCRPSRSSGSCPTRSRPTRPRLP